MMASSPTRHHIPVEKARFSRCPTTKIGYATRNEAFDTAETMMQQGNVMRGCHITPYQCDECGQWHVYNRQIVFGR